MKIKKWSAMKKPRLAEADLAKRDPSRVVVFGGREIPVVPTSACPRCGRISGKLATNMVARNHNGTRECLHCGLVWYMHNVRAVSRLEADLEAVRSGRVPESCRDWYLAAAARRVDSLKGHSVLPQRQD